MNKLVLILFTFSSLFYSQDRSTIFNTGTPSPEGGYLLTYDGVNGVSVADQFTILNDYVLEAMKFYFKMESDSDAGSVTVQLHEDSLNTPGVVIAAWQIQLDPTNDAINDYTVTTLDECNNMAMSNYWLSVSVNEPGVEVLWGYSSGSSYPVSRSTDHGETWLDAEIGNAGALIIWAEQIYHTEDITPPVSLGDTNLDGTVNVLDVVQVVNYIITGDIIFTPEQLDQADFNEDETVNVLDIVQMVNYILEPSAELMPVFTLTDINTNSTYFGQSIGPETFRDDISLYYFGKAG